MAAWILLCRGELPGRTVAGDERVHHAVAIRDVEIAEGVADLVHHERTGDLVAAARADVVVERDRAWIGADVREAARLPLVRIAPDIHVDPADRSGARLSVPVSSTEIDSRPPEYSMTARRSRVEHDRHHFRLDRPAVLIDGLDIETGRLHPPQHRRRARQADRRSRARTGGRTRARRAPGCESRRSPRRCGPRSATPPTASRLTMSSPEIARR